jgi:hypothetical protein
MVRSLLAEIADMKDNAVSQAGTKGRGGLVVVGLWLATVGVAVVAILVTSASASPIGKGGQVNACYQAKGKEKGSMRVVAGKHCRQGERKLAWSLAGSQGTLGALGVPGAQGTEGSPGADGPPGPRGDDGAAGADGVAGVSMATLESRVTSLESEVTDLTGDLADVEGALGDVCEQTEALNSQVNLVGSAIGDIQLIGGLVSLVLPEVDPLDPFVCGP